MLTGHVERWRVIEASRLGVNEFLKKPVSGKALLDRIVAILTQPRAMVRLGDYYGPEPRKLFFEPIQKLVTPAPAPTAALPAPKKAARCPRHSSRLCCRRQSEPRRQDPDLTRGSFAPVANMFSVPPWRHGPSSRSSNVTKRFGDFTAVDALTLDIFEREFFALLGPSGCGKTTLLRMLAGFETPDDRARRCSTDEDLAGVPPYRRPVNMMFQSYALFPHMTVAGNVAFGLKQDGLPKDEIAARVDEMLGAGAARRLRRPQAGSALRRPAPARRARALARQAPEGAAARRAARRARPQAARGDALRAEGAAARGSQTTFVIVTHDQDEAMTVADRIAVMNRGQLAQVGTPVEVYERPNSRWVAGFVGDVNLIEGRVTAVYPSFVMVEREGTAPARGACAGRAGRRSRSRCGRRRSVSATRCPRAPSKTAPPGIVTDIGYLGTVSHLQGAARQRPRAQGRRDERAARVGARDPCERPRLAVMGARRRRAADGVTHAGRATTPLG